MATESRTRAVAAADLPAVVGVRTRAVVAGHETVIVEFGNGASIHYRDRDSCIEERWIPPGTDPTDPAVTHEREADATAEALALRTLGEYLSFDDGRHATFVWGERNLDALLGR